MIEVALSLLKKIWLPVLIAVVIGVLAWRANHYRNNATEYKKQRDEKAQARQSDVAALDAKYTQELADERARNNALQRCVSTGKCGLHINAKYPANGTTGTGGLGDASGPDLLTPLNGIISPSESESSQ